LYFSTVFLNHISAIVITI